MMLNKKFSKLLCAVLAFAMIVTMLPAMALITSADEADTMLISENAGINKLAFSDIANSPYQREIGVLSAISVLAGDPEGTFRPGDSISRAEMAAIIVRIYGLESNVIPSATQFDDVPADHWASGYVNIASSLGVINGDGNGTFRPDDKVKYNEAVKMLVCVLGYGMHAQESGGWPAGYLVQATSLGVDEDVINQSGEASRETVAKLVYNTIDLEYLEKVGYGTDEQWVSVVGRTLLSEKMKVSKIEDVVSETYTASFMGEGSLKENEVRIGKEKFLLGDSDISKYIGYPVIAYAKFDPKVDKKLSTLAYYEVDEEDVEIIDVIPDDVAGATENSITLFEDYENSAKTITYTTKIDTYVFNNGIGDMNFDLSTLYAGGKAAFQGKLIIIDIDDDQVIDSLFVEDTETIVVDSIAKSSSGFYIRGKHTNERFPAKGMINTSDDEVKVTIMKDGEAIDYTDLEEYDVLTYTNNGNIYNFTVVAETVEGAIESITSDDEIVIDGKKYEKSPYYMDNVVKTLVEEPSVGDTVVMYLDSYGQIAYTEVTVTGGADTYAYVLGVEKEKGFEDEMAYSLILYTTDNEKVSVPLASKLTLKKNVYAFDVNEGTIESTDLQLETIEKRVTDVTAADLKQFGVFDAEGRPVTQLIKYAMTDDKISEIETALNIAPFAATGTVYVDTVENGVHSVVAVDAVANKNAITKINSNIFKVTPKKYDEENEVFTKTVMVDGSKEITSFCRKSSSFLSNGGSPTNADSAYKWKGSKILFIPNEAGSTLTSDISFFGSDEFFSAYNDYATFSTNDFEIYDCAKDGTVGMFILKPDVTKSAIVGDQRSSYMLVKKVGVGTNADGESEYRINGLSNNYNNPSTSEVAISLPEDVAITLANSAFFNKSDFDISDLGAGDIVNYRKLPNGKVYALKVLFSAKYNKGSYLSDYANTKNIKDYVDVATLYQSILYGNIVMSTTDDGQDYIRLTVSPEGSSLDLGSDSVTGDFNPAGFTNYWAYDVNKKTMKAIEFADVPIPEELDEDTLDLENLPANVFKLTDEDGNTYYAKCPKVMMHVHVGDSNWRRINFIYFDDGSFDY